MYNGYIYEGCQLRVRFDKYALQHVTPGYYYSSSQQHSLAQLLQLFSLPPRPGYLATETVFNQTATVHEPTVVSSTLPFIRPSSDRTGKLMIDTAKLY